MIVNSVCVAFFQNDLTLFLSRQLNLLFSLNYYQPLFSYHSTVCLFVYFNIDTISALSLLRFYVRILISNFILFVKTWLNLFIFILSAICLCMCMQIKSVWIFCLMRVESEHKVF